MAGAAPGFDLDTGTPGVLGVRGALDFSTAAAATVAIQAALSNPSIETLDLAKVSRADSAGLSSLVAILASAGKARTLKIVNMPAGLQALAKVSEVDRLIGV